jgi:hypothetical protein
MTIYILEEDGTIDLSSQEATANSGGNYTGDALNDTIYGSVGDDIIISGPDEPLQFGDNGRAPGDNDTIIQSSGDNILTGGYGNDTFAFVISFENTALTTFSTIEYNDGLVPADGYYKNSNGEWSSYLDGLEKWQSEMHAMYGDDLDPEKESVTYSFGAGKTQHEKTVYYDNSWTYQDSGSLNFAFSTNASSNVITDFGNGNDSIQLIGINADQFNDYGNVIVVDGNTVISIGDFSITLIGVTEFSYGDLLFAV